MLNITSLSLNKFRGDFLVKWVDWKIVYFLVFLPKHRVETYQGLQRSENSPRQIGWACPDSTRLLKITYDQESEFIGHELRKSLNEIEYGITDKPITLVNPTSNAILEWIHQVLVNIVRNFNINETNFEGNYPCSDILAASSFVIISMENRLKSYSPGQLVFDRDVILLIKHRVYW